MYDTRPNNGSNGAYPVIYHDTTPTIRYWIGATDRIISSALTLNAWHHIAVVRASAVTKLYIDGVQSGASYADSNNYLCDLYQRPIIGGDGQGDPCQSYIDEFRVTKGLAQWTGPFTPPTKAY
jgi:hypothetical protein